MVELDLERAITERDQAREACRQQAEKWKQASARADQAKSRIAELEGERDAARQEACEEVESSERMGSELAAERDQAKSRIAQLETGLRELQAAEDERRRWLVDG